MSATFVLVLVMLAALIHRTCAITCYMCKSKSEPACDDPFNRNSSGVHTLSCPSNACVKVKGRAKGKQTLNVLSHIYINRAVVKRFQSVSRSVGATG